ncbi:hypothetical protein Tco_0381338 [Tanacetum coccineum]
MYDKKNVDFVALLWEDFMFQADNSEISSARKEHMPYPRFMKVIINHFISKDKTISMRNKINLHTVCDDTLLATPKKARKFRKVASLLRKLSPILEEEHAVNSKRAKRPTKKSTIMPTTSVVIRDTPSEYVSKKKTPTKVDRSNGMDLLSNVALLKAAQLKKTLKKSKIDVDDDKEASDSEKTDSNEDEIPNLNRNDDEEEEHEEEYKTEVPVQSSSVSSDFANQFLNLDNVLPTDTEEVSMMNVKVRHEETSTQTPPLLNIPVTVIPKTSTATKSTIPPTIQPITHLQQQSTPTATPAPTTATTTNLVPALPDFSSLFRFDQRVSALEKKLSQFKQADYSIIPKEVSDCATPVIQSSINESLEIIVLAKCSSQPKSTYEAAASLTEFKLNKILLDKIQKIYSLKRDREDKDKDEDPLAGSDQGLKKQKTSSTSQPKSSGKSAQAEEPVFEVADTELPLNQRDDVGNTDDKPSVKEAPRDDWFKKPERPPTPYSVWNTAKLIISYHLKLGSAKLPKQKNLLSLSTS